MGSPARTSGGPDGEQVVYAYRVIAFDLVFSLDSVVTAIGMAQRLEIMVAAIVIAILYPLVLH